MAALLWIGYAALIYAVPVIVANLISALIECWTSGVRRGSGGTARKTKKIATAIVVQHPPVNACNAATTRYTNSRRQQGKKHANYFC